MAGASLPIETALLMGFSNLIADGISMGLGDFLSSKAEHEYEASESKREQWEFDANKADEVSEQVELFKKAGVTDFLKSSTCSLTRTRTCSPRRSPATQPSSTPCTCTMSWASRRRTPTPRPGSTDSWVRAVPANCSILYRLPSHDATRCVRCRTRRPPPAAPHPHPHSHPPPPFPPPTPQVTFFSFLAFGSVPVLTYLFTFLGGYRDAQGIFGITCGTTILTSEYPSL